MRKTIDRKKLLFVINRALIVLAFAAILIGLYHYEPNGPPDNGIEMVPSSESSVLLIDEWKMVLNNARILCLSCIGIE